MRWIAGAETAERTAFPGWRQHSAGWGGLPIGLRQAENEACRPGRLRKYWQSLPLLIETQGTIEGTSDMPTRNISLTPEQDAFIEDVIKSGEYQNASEAVRDALRVLRQRRREDVLKLKALRLQIKAGREAIDRGDFTDVDEAELDVFFEELISPAGKSSR
jgi:antitoxin ParD1/3/4